MVPLGLVHELVDGASCDLDSECVFVVGARFVLEGVDQLVGRVMSQLVLDRRLLLWNYDLSFALGCIVVEVA